MGERIGVWKAVSAIFIVVTIILASALGMVYSQYSKVSSQLESSQKAIKSLEERYKELTDAIKEYQQSFTKIEIPEYNSTGHLIGYKEIEVPTKSLEVGNLSLSGVKGLIKVYVYIQIYNNSGKWYTTYVVNGSDALAATLAIAKVNYTLGKYGTFVESINGISGNWYGNKTWWSFWYWDEKGKKWVLSPVTASQYTVKNGGAIAWVYTKYRPPENKPIQKPPAS